MTENERQDLDLDRVAARRLSIRARRDSRLVELLEAREDLRGVHAPADLAVEAVRWSA
jgi:hypothetical protein